MTELEVNDLLEYMSLFYKIKINDKMINAWLNTLHQYDCEEVKKSLDEAMSEERFQREPPQAQYLVRGLVKKYDKVDYSKQVIYCQICNRPLNQGDYDRHFDRCSSIEYILNQCKRFNAPCSYSKKELFEMLDESFEEYYKKILRYVQEHTTDKSEKQRIEFIFNPPSEEKAKKFLSKGR